MLSGMAGDDSVPKLDKEIIGRLKNPTTRAAAMGDLAKMMAPIVAKGWEGGVPNVPPEMVNVVTIAGLSTSGYTFSCDATRVADFIMRSNDLEVEQLPADLQSRDPQVVKVAKMRVQQILKDQRAAEGIMLLRSHMPDLTGTDLELLEKHIPVAQRQNLLSHVVDQDEYMDQSLQVFQDLLESAKIIEAGLKARTQE